MVVVVGGWQEMQEVRDEGETLAQASAKMSFY